MYVYSYMNLYKKTGKYSCTDTILYLVTLYVERTNWSEWHYVSFVLGVPGTGNILAGSTTPGGVPDYQT